MKKCGKTVRDLYETPTNAVQAMVDVLKLNGIDNESFIWECCSGNSAITQVLKNNGFDEIIETDLFPPNADMEKLDFYEDEPEFKFDYIITNPPYDQKELFVKRCQSYGVPFALLLPLETMKLRVFREMATDIQLLILNRGLKFKTEDGSDKMIPVCAWYFIGFPPLEFENTLNCGVSFAN